MLFQDDFDRANSSDLGGGWQEVTGNAQIDANRLRTAVLGSGSTVATYIHTSETMVVDVNILFDSSSIAIERAGVIVNYLDANNYLYVQIEATFSAFAGTIRTRLQFFRRSGGVDTQLGSTRTIDGSNGIANHQIRVCYDGTYLKAMGYREAATKLEGGFRAGVYSNSTSAVYFNNFRLWRFDPKCPNCAVTPSCFYCLDTAEPTGAIVLDFGAATLTDSNWNACDQIAGEYVLELDDFNAQSCGIVTLPKCTWLYSSLSGTYTDAWCPTARNVSLCLGAQPTGIEWLATLRVTSDPCIGGSVLVSADYRGALSVAGVCTESPVTLTKQWEFIKSTPPCTGSLPATIQLRLTT